MATKKLELIPLPGGTKDYMERASQLHNLMARVLEVVAPEWEVYEASARDAMLWVKLERGSVRVEVESPREDFGCTPF